MHENLILDLTLFFFFSFLFFSSSLVKIDLNWIAYNSIQPIKMVIKKSLLPWSIKSLLQLSTTYVK